MSNFLINPYIFGAKVSDTLHIDASSASQDDFDVEVAGAHELRISWIGVQATSASIDVTVSHDNGSTFETGAADYANGQWETGGHTDDVSDNSMLITGMQTASANNAGVAVVSGLQSGVICGMNHHNGRYASGFGLYLTDTSEVTHVRLGVPGNWTSGTIQVERITYAARSIMTQVDFSVTSSPNNPCVYGDTAHRAALFVVGMQGASNNRYQMSWSDDAGTTVGDASHSGGYLNDTNNAQSNIPYVGTGTFSNYSFDAGIKYGCHHITGLNDTDMFPWATAVTYTGGAVFSSPTFGRLAQVDSSVFHSWSDGVGYNSGTISGEMYEYATRSIYEDSVSAGADSTFVIPVEGYDGCDLIFGANTTLGNPYLSGADVVTLEFSTDGGSTYVSAGYYGSRMDHTTNDTHFNQSEWELSGSTTVPSGGIRISGFSAGNYVNGYGNIINTTSINGGQVWSGTNTSTTAKVTHIRLGTAGAATFSDFQLQAQRFKYS